VTANHVRNVQAAEALLTRARANGCAIDLLRADVSTGPGIATLRDWAVALDGGLHSMIFAAATGVHRPFEQLTARHFDFTFALNVKAFLLVMQALSPFLATGATVVVLSSEGASLAVPQYHLVGASKGAIESLARHMAVELAPRGVRVNILSPGTVVTDAWRAMPDAEARLAREAQRSPRGRLNTVGEVALAAQFLASDASGGLIGHTLVCDGGARIRSA
jgi:enoyl-[acyl-carrier protein] reductase III